VRFLNSESVEAFPCYRDLKATAYDVARFAKARQPRDLIEIVDLATGEKTLMLADGRTG
jgi:hypothetical protein